MRSKLFHTRVAWAMAMAVGIGALAGCGQTPPELMAPTRPPISTLDIDGHSLAYGVAADKEGPHGTGATSQVAKALHLKENNQSAPGATLQESGVATDGWGNVLRSYPRQGTGDVGNALPRMALLWYGANDLLLYGDNLSLAKEAYRTIISRARSSAVFEAGNPTDASIAADKVWQPVEVDAGTASGGSVLTTKRPGAIKIEIRKGTLAGGSTVDLGFTQDTGTSADYTIKVDGQEQGRLATRGPLTPLKGDYMPEHTVAASVYRIENMSDQAHTIEIDADRVERETSFDYWEVEPPNPEPVVLVQQYGLPPLSEEVAAAFPNQPTNAEYRSANAMATSLAREFGPRVMTVDTEPVVRRSPALLAADNLHLSQRGYDAVAKTIVAAIRQSDFADELTQQNP